MCGALLAWAAPIVSAQTPAPSVQTSTAVDYNSARLARKLLATRASGPISLDGALDEPAWRDAPVASGFLQNEPSEGQPATFDTEVRVLYDDQALYFGVFAQRR